MPKSVKFALYAFGVLLVFLIVALGSIALFIDPNDYKQQIASRIEGQIGRPVHLRGKITWSVYPILGIKTNNIAIDNPDGFDKNHMAVFAEFDLGIKTLPLLFSQRFEIDHLVAKNGQIWLLTNNKGSQNWSGLGNKQKQNGTKQNHNGEADTDNKQTKKTDQSAVKEQDMPSISYLHVENTNIDWINKQKNEHYKLTDLDINIRNFKFHQSFDLALNCNLSGAQMPVTHWQLRTKIHPDLAENKFSFDPLNITIKSSKGDSLGDIRGPFKIKYQDKGYKLDGETHIDVNPYTSAKTFGVTLNPGFTRFSFNSVVKLVNNNLTFHHINGQINDKSYQGRIELRNLPNPDLEFGLNFRQIDMDGIIAQNAQNKTLLASSKLKQHNGSARFQHAAKQTENHNSNIYAPLEALRNIQGEVTVDKLINKVRFNNIKAVISNNGDSYHIKPLVAHVADGKLSGDMTFDRHQKTWTNHASLDIESVAVGKLLQQLRQNVWITGDLNGQATVKSFGTSLDQIVQNSQGSGDLKIVNGKLIGFDLVDKTKQALQVIRMTGISTSLPSMNNVTPFNTLSTNFRLNYPMLNQYNILLNNDFLEVSGKGVMNLDSKMINYDLKAVPKKKEVIIPISVTGHIDNIQVQPNVNSIMQQFLFGG